MRISLVLSVLSASVLTEWKCVSTPTSLEKTSNSSVPSLVKAMEGGPLWINSVFEEAKENKSKIFARKGVNDTMPSTFSHDIAQKVTPSRDWKSKDDGKVASAVQETFSNGTKPPLLNSTASALNLTDLVVSTPTAIRKTHVTQTEPTVVKRKKKPFFTMIVEDELLKDAESFIESPTTGRDYVLPIVLFILLFPAVIFMIKLIYKRGTEFTERQQYHRMYLIDGMYNTR